ncbi:protoporphyrinogen/coproporphyrinogen oxidase [Motilimonas sp. 1_MG-2023]|uniref:protoporphyrinogen/coproporphyrinogen oxidase n=1 Tax=Motilimonas TaxID=1914248 RepID=UPI0026E1C0A4|nr:FAD-dependent oxidoreductase [Motilimonas sp. 1_MG-2023]MDO6524959.1 FAD-dependent oxidoreductase [Motilimonas sp. 1_MG-2023]
MHKHILVVGAGVVGLTAAYSLVKEGHKVTLLDSDKAPGGLLKSTETPFGYFDYGTHVASTTGIQGLDSFLFEDLDIEMHSFDVGIASSFYQKMSEVSPFINLNNVKDIDSGEIANSILAIKDTNEAENLAQKYRQHFGDRIYSKVFSGVVGKYFGVNAELLSASCYPFFDLNRAIAFDATTTEYLKQLPIYNERLGFHGASKGVKKYYPVDGGIGAWYHSLLKKTIAAGVNLISGCELRDIVSSNGSITKVVTSHGAFEVDVLFWAVPSPILSRFLDVPTSVSKPEYRPTALYHFAFDKPIKTDSYYINVPDPSLIAGRLTIYQNLNPNIASSYNLTVEALNDKEFDFEAATVDVLQELQIMGLITAQHQCLYQACERIKQGFPVITAKIEAEVQSFNNMLLNNFQNLTLLGRGNCKGFFMSTLLQQAFTSSKEASER